MNWVSRKSATLLQGSGGLIKGCIVGCSIGRGSVSESQQSRGIRVKVLNGNLEQALNLLQAKMRSSGMERQIKKMPVRHIKNSEKRVLARKNLLRRIQSDDLARKLQTILIRKVRGF